MQEPNTWDLELFLENEDPRVQKKVKEWVNEIQKHFESKTAFSLSFEVAPGALTPEGASMPVLERLLFTYGNLGVETRIKPGWKKDKGHIFQADFDFKVLPD